MTLPPWYHFHGPIVPAPIIAIPNVPGTVVLHRGPPGVPCGAVFVFRTGGYARWLMRKDWT